ncbi:MAG: phosphate propanoyltransferase [Mycobacterium leprae]
MSEEKRLVVLNVSARHIHLSQKDLEALFGPGAQLTEMKPLMQPGQFAANEQVAVIGPKGTFAKVRVLGPVRGDTQLEVSLTDARTLGVAAPVRMSGDVAGTPGIILEGPKGRVEIAQGVIAAARHIHLDLATAEKFGLKDKQVVRVKVNGGRPLTFDDVVVRVSANYAPECHIDTDEANAALVKDGTMVEILG